jgi:hypothetical protein
MFGEDHD